MAVPAGPTEQRYVGNGVTTIYTVPFLVIQASDLAVYIDGVKLTSGYTQTGVGNPTSSVTFSIAPANLSQILFALEVPFERLNDYQENGDFLAKTVNNDYDRIWQALKQLLRYSDRSLRLGQFDVDGQGWYRAKGNGIRDLHDPVEDQDAATRGWTDAFVADLISQVSGPINNANNVFYQFPDGTSHVVQDLAGANGAAGVGFGGSNVSVALGRIIRPEQFPVAGPVGVGNAVADTAAWQAAANALQSGGKFKAEGNYLINGQVIFPFRTDCHVQLKGSTITQQLNFSKTLRFTEHLGLEVTGGKMFGRGGAAGEYNGASSSYNGVAAMYFDGGDDITVDGLRAKDHAGGCVVMMGVRTKLVKNCIIQGIGYPYIDPVGQGNQGNGSDFGIMCQPKDNSLGWIYEDRFENNRIWNTAFGIQTVQTSVCEIIGNRIGPILGQHGIYGIENDGFKVIGNTFTKCFQGGVKTQFENYSGFNIGPLWVSGTSYTVGQKVRFSSILWICTVANSDVVFTSSKWVVDPLTFRKGTMIHDNTFEGNGYDILVVSSSLSDGREIYNRSASIKSNVSRDCVNNSISIDRCVDVDISDNDIDTCIYGIFGRDLSGRIANNTVRSPSKNACATSLYSDMVFDNNNFINAGLSGTGDDSRAAVLIYAPTAAGIPSQSANPRVFWRNNGLKWPSGDALGNYLVFDADTRNRWYIEGTYGTTTAKKFRIDGQVVYQFRNHFAANGYLNTAQNEPAYTVTNGSTLRAFDPTTVTTAQLGNVVGTLINDQKAKNIFK